MFHQQILFLIANLQKYIMSNMIQITKGQCYPFSMVLLQTLLGSKYLPTCFIYASVV